MARITLKRLLNKKDNSESLLTHLNKLGIAFTIQDEGGNVLFGAASNNAERYPVTFQDEVLGWVRGDQIAALIAALLTALAAGEAENTALLDDTLGLYREINLLYNLSDKLASSLDIDSIAALALSEARRLIHATGGAVILAGESSAEPYLAAGFDPPGRPGYTDRLPASIMTLLINSYKAEIVNDVGFDGRYTTLAGVNSLIYAHLDIKERRLGVLALLSESAINYSANELKLLSALASQTAPVIDNALQYRRTIQEAREHEERLQKQIHELHIELNEARQEKQVAEITETEYFQQLSSQVDQLRRLMSD